MNSFRGVFPPSKRDCFGSQFTLKSLFTQIELISKNITKLWQTRTLLKRTCHLLFIVGGVKLARSVISCDVVSKKKGSQKYP